MARPPLDSELLAGQEDQVIFRRVRPLAASTGGWETVVGTPDGRSRHTPSDTNVGRRISYSPPLGVCVISTLDPSAFSCRDLVCDFSDYFTLVPEVCTRLKSQLSTHLYRTFLRRHVKHRQMS